MIIENAPESEYLEYLTEETELLQHTTFIDTTGLYAFVDGTYLNVVSASSPYLLDEITYLG